jgi:hypothetical protein
MTEEARQQERERFCNRILPRNRISVVAQDVPVSESNERSMRTLTYSRASLHQGTAVLGVTETAFGIDMSAELNTEHIPGQSTVCSRLELDVVVSMKFHAVNIARELRPGTCGYEKVREHEYRHVAVNRKTLQTAATVLETEMSEFFGNQIFYGDPAALHAQLKSALQAHWLPRLEQLKEEGLAAHRELDTPEEYASNSTDCEGEIVSLITADSKLAPLLDTPVR